MTGGYPDLTLPVIPGLTRDPGIEPAASIFVSMTETAKACARDS